MNKTGKLYRGGHVFEINNDIVKISNGGKNTPVPEWEHTASFQKVYLKEIIAGLRALEQYKARPKYLPRDDSKEGQWQT